MALEELIGQVYGPFPLRVCGEKVSEYVAATGDDADRWGAAAPPGFAAVALFAAAPRFLGDPRVAPDARMVIHGDQFFRWHRAWKLEEDLEVTGAMTKARSRGGVALASFEVQVDDAAGDRVVDAISTFLMSGEAPRSESGEEPEPPPDERGPSEVPRPAALPASGARLQPLPKSAGRSDLVRYAAATRDWNAIHWDHEAARRAGLPGVVCHGLLMAAWVMQAAARYAAGGAPLAEARFRFRSPLRPAVAAEVVGEVSDPVETGPVLKMAVMAAGQERVAATVALRGR